MEIDVERLRIRIANAGTLFQKIEGDQYKTHPASSAKHVFRNLLIGPNYIIEDLITKPKKIKEFDEDMNQALMNDLSAAETYVDLLENHPGFAREETGKTFGYCPESNLSLHAYVETARQRLNTPIDKGELIKKAENIREDIEQRWAERNPPVGSRFSDVARNLSAYLGAIAQMAKSAPQGTPLGEGPFYRLERKVQVGAKYLSLLDSSPDFYGLELHDVPGKDDEKSYLHRARKKAEAYKRFGFEGAQEMYVALAERALNKGKRPFPLQRRAE